MSAAYWMSQTQATASKGEEWAVQKLRKLGYQADLYNDFFEQGKDILINGVLACEVKTSTQGQTTRRYKDKVYHYPTWKWLVSNVTTEDKVLILLAIDCLGIHHPFVMPSAWMVGRSHFSLSSYPPAYGGFIAPGLNNWSVVDYLLKRRYEDAGQLDIFNIVEVSA